MLLNHLEKGLGMSLAFSHRNGHIPLGFIVKGSQEEGTAEGATHAFWGTGFPFVHAFILSLSLPHVGRSPPTFRPVFVGNPFEISDYSKHIYR